MRQMLVMTPRVGRRLTPEEQRARTVAPCEDDGARDPEEP
jgi:hypothetical protein